MARKTADQIIAKYQQGVAGGAQYYTEGVQNPSRPWASSTQQGAKRWASGIQQAIQNGSFAKGVAAAGDQKWQQAAISKGAQRYSAAANDAAQAYAGVAAKIMAAGQAAQSAVASMPDDTLEARIARSAVAQRAISKAWGRS